MNTRDTNITRIKEVVEEDWTKSDTSHYEFDLDEYTLQLFRKIKDEQEENKRLFGANYFSGDYVFTWPDGRPFSPDYVTKSFKKVMENNEKLPSVLTFHDLRKSSVSILHEAGYNVVDIQERTRHADLSTTLQIYTKVKQSKVNQEGKYLADRFMRAEANVDRMLEKR